MKRLGIAVVSLAGLVFLLSFALSNEERSYPYYPDDVAVRVFVNGRWMGSGAFVSEHWVLTAAHVILLADKYEEKLPTRFDIAQLTPAPEPPSSLTIEVEYKGKRAAVSRYEFAPDGIDLALLYVPSPPRHISVPLELSRRVRFQEKLFYAGFVQHQIFLAHTYVINPSALTKWSPNLGEGKEYEMIWHQYRTGPGSSGSLVVTTDGKGVAVIVGGNPYWGIAVPLAIEPIGSWLQEHLRGD